jgi:prevent-host-death family protein
MTTYSTSDLSRRSGDIIAEALRRPVTIVQRNKPRLVLLSIEDYRALVTRADTRTTGTLETMPDALFEAFRGAVDASERDGEDR